MGNAKRPKKPRILLERINITEEFDDFDKLLKILNDVHDKYPDKQIEFDYHFGSCYDHGGDPCYCPETSIEVCVYDVPRMWR